MVAVDWIDASDLIVFLVPAYMPFFCFFLLYLEYRVASLRRLSTGAFWQGRGKKSLNDS